MTLRAPVRNASPPRRPYRATGTLSRASGSSTTSTLGSRPTTRSTSSGTRPGTSSPIPALAARLLGVDAPALLAGRSSGPAIPRDGTPLGALFEGLVGLSVRVDAAHSEARVRHMRNYARGRQEVDLIVERDDGRVVAIEAKLTRTVENDDVRHLLWLGDKLGNRLLDSIVVTTGPAAYRRTDHVAVVPLALLGP